MNNLRHPPHPIRSIAHVRRSVPPLSPRKRGRRGVITAAVFPICELILFAVILSLTCAAQAQDIVAASQIISGDEIALQDGRVLRLAGVKAVTPNAKTFLESAVLNHALVLQDAKPDRYGRVNATASVQGQAQSIEESLLSQGLAFVYPAVGDDRLDSWLDAERQARREKRGTWADHPDVPAQDAPILCGKYGFVAGTVSGAERIKNKVYLHLGEGGQTDFTLEIAAHFLRALRKRGLDPLALQGKKLRIRGWVKRDIYPTITLSDPHQIEAME
ncbi:MAG: thermonuclease family protein [Alphaproteobacteria bacterium]|nr:thermonuclease family protein [Alphaproteobacteria bacterium]